MPRRATSEADVVDLVRRCRRAGAPARSLRVHGARHSVAPAIGTGRRDGVELRIDALADIAFEGARRVHVGAGCRLGGAPHDRSGLARAESAESSLSAALVRRGLALPNLAGIAHQSLAGFLATGSAGGSFRYGLHDAVQAIRLVDGTGQVHDVGRGDPRFGYVGVAMGLFGVVTQVTLDAEEHYDVFGSEVVVTGADVPFDLRAAGKDGVAAFLEPHDYARILWWPRAPADRFVIWSARRARPDDYDARSGPPGALRPRAYQPLPRIAGSHVPMQWLAGVAVRGLEAVPDARAALVGAFVRPGAQRFWDRWDRALPMDAAVDEQLLPFEFAELWFPPERVHEALARLAAFFDRFGTALCGHFAVEIYGGPPSPFAMSPGGDAPSVRINLLYPRHLHIPAARAFAPLWDLFEDMAPRLHWGKHLPPPPRAAGWIARAFPRRDRFLALREEFDPDGLFLSDYFRVRLGAPDPAAKVVSPCPPLLSSAPIAPTVSPRVRWPLLFDLEPVGPEFVHECSRQMSFAVDAQADPELVFDAFVYLGGAGAWLDHFVAREVDPEDPRWTFEEHFTFMRLRCRTLVSERPHRWVARVDAASLPIATRMIESVELTRHPSGRTSLHWRFLFDPHPSTTSVEPWVTRAFEGWLRASMRRFGPYLERRSGIVPIEREGGP